MPTEYVIILGQRRHFGDQQDLFGTAPFIGPDDSVFEGQFTFNCPDIDPTKDAILMFQVRDVDHEQNVFRVNEMTVFGGLPVSPAKESANASGWNSNVLIVNAHRHSLGETANRLMIGSRDKNGKKTGNRDDFVIDNIVMLYQTRSRRPVFVF